MEHVLSSVQIHSEETFMYKEMLENYRNIVSVMTANGVNVPQETIAILGICLCGAQKEGCKVIVNEKKDDNLVILVDGSTYEFNSEWYEKIMKSTKQPSDYKIANKSILNISSDEEKDVCSVPDTDIHDTKDEDKKNILNKPDFEPVNNDFKAIGDTEVEDYDSISHFVPQEVEDDEETLISYNKEEIESIKEPENIEKPENDDISLIIDDDSPIFEEPKVVKTQKIQESVDRKAELEKPAIAEQTTDENETTINVLLKLLQNSNLSASQETKDYTKIKDMVDKAVQEAFQKKLSEIVQPETESSVKKEIPTEEPKQAQQETVVKKASDEKETAPELIPDEDEETLLSIEQPDLAAIKEDSDNEEILLSVAEPVHENRHLSVEEIKNNLRAQRNEQILETMKNQDTKGPEVVESTKIEEFSSEDVPEEVKRRIVIPEITGEAIKKEQNRETESKPSIAKNGEESINENNLYYDRHEISFVNEDNQKESVTILIYPLNKDTSLSAAPIVAVANFNGKIRTEIMQSGGLAVLDFETFALSARGRWIGTGFQSLIKQYNGKISELTDNVKKNESENVPGFIKKVFDGEEFYIFPASVINNLNGMCPIVAINMSNQIHGKNGTIKYASNVSDMNGFIKCNTSFGSHTVNAFWSGIPGKDLSLNVCCK